ncbi:hypothetical protein EV702DRAFT_1062464 [Suillus placidus]|uniref:40S ribosomal protein S9 n=1 Tax=Suillus placidus TaxID=48579 RepID=A0A9P7A6K7_9AGAM|nr:hypothetical protein EV702DRAFT_1062464 [Suillus placidus]
MQNLMFCILQLAGEYGLRNKPRELLKLDDKDPKCLFEGNALIRRLVRIGVLDETRMHLDYVLALKVDFLERRLKTQVFKTNLAKSIHHARVLIRQRHIRYQIVNIPSNTSPYGGGRPGRVKRKPAAAAAKREEGGEEEEEEYIFCAFISVSMSFSHLCRLHAMDTWKNNLLTRSMIRTRLVRVSCN